MAQIRNDDVKHKIEVSLNIAKVKNISHEKGFGFIEPLDDSIKSNLFVHKTKMKDFDSVRSGDFVKYENYEKSDRSLVANNVEPLSENEKKEYENAKKKYYISEKGSLKCSCGEGNSDFHPDYRSLHYIADEILGHVRDVKERKGYGESIKQIPGGFDDILNDDLKNSIKASRYLDLGETVSAIAEVKVTNDHRPGNYSVKPLLLQRIASKLDKLKGKEFIKLVQMEKEIKKKM
jgi:cold shock CspA family protein